MLLTWRPDPEGQDQREFAFKPGTVLTPEAEAIEGVGGDFWESWDEFLRLLAKGNRRALRAALWIMLRRPGHPDHRPGLKFTDLQLRTDEVQIAWDEEEKAQMRARAAEPGIDAETREALLEVAGPEPERPAPKDPPGSEPKNSTSPSPDAAPNTAGS